MKLLIIGNSHMVSLAKAINNHLKVDLLAVAGAKLLPNLEIDQESRLYSKDIKIQSLIEERKLKTLSDYSAVIIYGCQLRSKGSGRNWFSHIKKSNDDFSSAFKNAVIDEFITNTVHYKFLAQHNSIITGLKNTRFISMPCPKPNELMPAHTTWELSIPRALAVEQKIKSVWKQLGIELLDTPKILETGDGIATNSKYKNIRAQDFSHLNDLGGELVMDEIVSFLKRLF